MTFISWAIQITKSKTFVQTFVEIWPWHRTTILKKEQRTLRWLSNTQIIDQNCYSRYWSFIIRKCNCFMYSFVLCLNCLKQTFTSRIFLFSDEKETSASWITLDVSPSLTTTSSPIRAKAEKANKYNALKRHCSYLFKITLGIQTRMRLMIVIVIDRRESNDWESL